MIYEDKIKWCVFLGQPNSILTRYPISSTRPFCYLKLKVKLEQTFSSFKLIFRQSATIVKDGDADITVGMCLSIDEMVRSEPCLANQVGDEALSGSSSSNLDI